MKLPGFVALSAALSCAVWSSGTAWAANCANVSFSPSSTPVISYDPIKATQSATTSVTATISGFVSSNDKTFRLILTDTNTGTPLRVGSTGPIYAITQGADTSSYQSGTTADGTTVTKVSIPGGASPSVTLTFTVALPVNSSGQDFTGGTTYSESSLGYSLQCYKQSSNGGADTGTAFALNTQIAKVLSLVTASPQTINFGNFTTTSQTLQVNLKSTNTMSVSVTTTNGSKMVLSGAVGPFPSNSTIPYTMTFGGSTLTTSSAITAARASVSGSSYAFVLSLPGGIPSGKLPGSYSDVITLTIVPSP